MHGGEHQGYRPGRGFVSASMMSEPATEPAAPAEPAAPSWEEHHADYEARLRAHQEEAAAFGGKKQAQSGRRRSEWDWLQDRQMMGTGAMGFRNFAQGRTELTGTPKYDVDWLTKTRPEVERGIGPMGGTGIGGAIGRRVTKNVLGNRAAALETERQYLEMTKPPEEPEFTVEPTPLVGGPFSSFPRGGTLPKGTQFSNTSFDRM